MLQSTPQFFFGWTMPSTLSPLDLHNLTDKDVRGKAPPVLWVDNALYSLSPLDADLHNLTDNDVRCTAHCSTLVDSALHSLPTGCKSTRPDWLCCWPRTDVEGERAEKREGFYF